METHMSSFRPSWCLLAVLVLTAAGCGVQRPARPRLGEVERLPRLETSPPERTTLLVRADYTATVDALEKAELCAQVRGIVNTVPADVDIGRAVKKGEVLLTLDIPDLVAERANKRALLEQAGHLQKQSVQARNVAAEEVK